MPNIAIVGAGPGLGLSIARRFGREGFTVALVARTQAKLHAVTDSLAAEGITARGYTADVTVPETLTAALSAIERDLGPIDVLEYSPAPTGQGSEALAAVPAAEVTVAALAPQIEYYLYGGVTAVQAVLPQMRQRRSGTIFVTTGASSGPIIHPPFGNIAAASGALRNWVLNLHDALQADAVYAVHVALAVLIGKGGTDSDPDVIAEQYWHLYEDRTPAELFWYDPTLGQ